MAEYGKYCYTDFNKNCSTDYTEYELTAPCWHPPEGKELLIWPDMNLFNGDLQLPDERRAFIDQLKEMGFTKFLLSVEDYLHSGLQSGELILNEGPTKNEKIYPAMFVNRVIKEALYTVGELDVAAGKITPPAYMYFDEPEKWVPALPTPVGTSNTDSNKVNTNGGQDLEGYIHPGPTIPLPSGLVGDKVIARNLYINPLLSVFSYFGIKSIIGSWARYIFWPWPINDWTAYTLGGAPLEFWGEYLDSLPENYRSMMFLAYTSYTGMGVSAWRNKKDWNQTHDWEGAQNRWPYFVLPWIKADRWENNADGANEYNCGTVTRADIDYLDDYLQSASDLKFPVVGLYTLDFRNEIYKTFADTATVIEMMTEDVKDESERQTMASTILQSKDFRLEFYKRALNGPDDDVIELFKTDGRVWPILDGCFKNKKYKCGDMFLYGAVKPEDCVVGLIQQMTMIMRDLYMKRINRYVEAAKRKSWLIYSPKKLFKKVTYYCQYGDCTKCADKGIQSINSTDGRRFWGKEPLPFCGEIPAKRNNNKQNEKTSSNINMDTILDLINERTLKESERQKDLFVLSKMYK